LRCVVFVAIIFFFPRGADYSASGRAVASTVS
jgi:hypothetical protein